MKRTLFSEMVYFVSKGIFRNISEKRNEAGHKKSLFIGKPTCGLSVCIFILLFYSSLAAAPLKCRVNAKSALLMNAETGAVLYEKRGDELAYPASTTKIATALFAIKQAQMDGKVKCLGQCLTRIPKHIKISRGYKIPPYWLEPDASTIYLKRGDELSVKDLLYGMMLASGNDAANVLAHHAGSDIFHFMKGLNGYLKEIGCSKTHFANPHGLHYPSHQTTAYDLALITKEALKDPLFCEVFKAESYEIEGREIEQGNRLVLPGKFFYEKSIGGKIGYTEDAGYCLVAAARDSERTLIAVLLGCGGRNERFRDAITLFDRAFTEEKQKRLLYNRDDADFVSDKGYRARLEDDLFISYFPSEECEITHEVIWDEIKTHVKKGEAIGSVIVKSVDGRPLAQAKLHSIKTIEVPRRHSYLPIAAVLLFSLGVFALKRKIQ